MDLTEDRWNAVSAIMHEGPVHTDRHGLPVIICPTSTSVSQAEVKLVTRTLEERFVAEPPERLIGDRAYDSERLDREVLQRFGTEVIAPNRRGRRSGHQTRDGRSLRRYASRWKVKRMFTRIYDFRRLVVRWEYDADNHLGFLHLACALILLLSL